jgi:prolyl-tRNA synthetase
MQAGSKEEKSGNHLLKNFYQVMQEMLGNDLIVDDRLDQTVGKRLLEAKKLGIPYIAVFGKSLLNELHPFIELQDVNSGQVHSLNNKDIVKFLYDAKAKATIK